MKTEQYSHEQIATNWRLWMEYVDPSGVQSYEEWDAMPVHDRITLIQECFGVDTSDK